MNKNTIFLFVTLFSSVVLWSCENQTDYPPNSIQGYSPVYFQRNGLDTVSFDLPQPTIEG